MERPRATIMSIDKTIRRVDNVEDQERENLSYWQSLPVVDRLSAVWDASAAAYSFAAAFQGGPAHDARRSERSLTRVQRSLG